MHISGRLLTISVQSPNNVNDAGQAAVPELSILLTQGVINGCIIKITSDQQEEAAAAEQDAGDDSHDKQMCNLLPDSQPSQPWIAKALSATMA